MASPYDPVERAQERTNWELAVQMANNWRRMLDVPEVNYPYPGSPRDPLSTLPPVISG
jgi:hypothetical protein